MRNGFAGFATGLARGIDSGIRLSDKMDEWDMRRGLSRAAEIKPEESSQFTSDQAQQLEAAASARDEAGNPLYNVEAKEGGTYSVTPAAGGETGTLAPVKHYTLGENTQEKPFTESEIGLHRINAMADVAMRFGDPVKAAQLSMVATKRRESADQDAIRAALANSRPSDGGSAVPGLQRQDQGYLETVGPRVTQTLLQQGKINEAKAWRDFTESEQGRAYASDFAKVQKMVSAGDYEGAIPLIQQLHGQFPDGKRAQTEHIGDGQYRITMIDEATGEPKGQRVMAAADLSRLAINALSPTKMVETMIASQAKRDAETASLNKSIELENLRQKGRDLAEDRRDSRLVKQIEAANARAANRGGLTAAQERGNLEIDAAREAVAGLSPQEIMRRTAKATNTGRENPDYDPSIARQAALASRRKLGEDDWFDRSRPPKPSSGTLAGKPLDHLTEGQLQQFGRSAGTEGKAKIDAELARRSLAGMPGMDGHRIGEYVEGRGYQVLDSQGRPVSYLRRRAQ